jgi:hypothetical protein
MTNDQIRCLADIIYQAAVSFTSTSTMNSGDRGTRFRVHDETVSLVQLDAYFVDISIRRALETVDVLQRK